MSSNTQSSGNKKLQTYFADKPTSHKIFEILRKKVEKDDVEMTVGSQISFTAKKKFAWIWLYNVTSKNPEGTVQIMLALDKKIDEPPVYRVTQISKNRWNHLVVVHSVKEAQNRKLAALIRAAHKHGAA